MNATLRLLVCSACLLIVAAGCSPNSGAPAAALRSSNLTNSDYLAGRNEAQQDFHNGLLMVKTYGLPQPWSQVYCSNLLSRYQVATRYVAGCDVNDKLAQNVQGYNEIVAAEIAKRYGADLLDRVAKESARQYEAGFTNR